LLIYSGHSGFIYQYNRLPQDITELLSNVVLKTYNLLLTITDKATFTLQMRGLLFV
jgi:hypothetical protein